MTLDERVRKAIRDVPDFPKPGILFKDITPILNDPELFREIIDAMANELSGQKVEGIAGIESRGFLFGPSIANKLDVPFIMIRKKGKLPYKTASYNYNLEYGTAEVEIHIDAVHEGQKIIIHDDVLATGGTAAAAAELILSQNACVAGFNFLVELTFLNGHKAITKYSENISNLVGF